LGGNKLDKYRVLIFFPKSSATFPGPLPGTRLADEEISKGVPLVYPTTLEQWAEKTVNIAAPWYLFSYRRSAAGHGMNGEKHP
jgi:hypothetical protein